MAIDDPESMSDSDAGPTALETLTLLTSALAKLDVGLVEINAFGFNRQLVHSLSNPLSISHDFEAIVLSKFTFMSALGICPRKG